MPEMPEVKKCRECGNDKPVEDYALQQSSQDGRGRVCSNCKLKYRNDHYGKKSRRNRNVRTR